MKLLYCKSCNDLFSLNIDNRTCQCGETGGHYKDNKLDIVIYGHAVPVGINNNFFLTAVDIQNDYGEGIPIEAFVMPKNCPTVTYKDNPDPLLANVFVDTSTDEEVKLVIREENGLDYTYVWDKELDDPNIYRVNKERQEELKAEKDKEISNKVKKVKNVFKDKNEE